MVVCLRFELSSVSIVEKRQVTRDAHYFFAIYTDSYC